MFIIKIVFYYEETKLPVTKNKDEIWVKAKTVANIWKKYLTVANIMAETTSRANLFWTTPKMAEMADKPDSVNVATVLVNETQDEIQEESQEVINIHVNVNANANSSLIADTSTSHLFAVFGTIADALNLVKSFFTDEYLCCSKAQLLDKIREQVADVTEVLRYARDLLFTVIKRRKNVSSKFAGRKKNCRWLAGQALEGHL